RALQHFGIQKQHAANRCGVTQRVLHRAAKSCDPVPAPLITLRIPCVRRLRGALKLGPRERAWNLKQIVGARREKSHLGPLTNDSLRAEVEKRAPRRRVRAPTLERGVHKAEVAGAFAERELSA